MKSPEQCVVRVGTMAFKRGETYHYGRTIRVLKSLTTYDLLEGEEQAVGTWDALNSIVNIDKVEDGLYSVILCNIGRDWESGHIDECDFKLVPYNGET